MTIEKELEEVQEKIRTLPGGIELVSCVEMMVRFRIRKTSHKQLDICLQFPPNYPNSLILMELKSKTVPVKFLDSVCQVFEKEKEKYLGGPQVILAVRFVLDALDSNPLCLCVEEISNLRRRLESKSGGENSFLKIKQKQSAVQFRFEFRDYFLAGKLLVPENYPLERVALEISGSNFPRIFRTFFEAQAKELARQCVEPPILRGKNKKGGKVKDQGPFEPKPSFELIAKFLLDASERYPSETCRLCQKMCFPKDTSKVVEDENNELFVERVYCGDSFHFGCLDKYMKTPPFAGGKKCPGCEAVIYHDKWRASDQIREERWAHQQAKARELEEVEDFLS